MWIVSPPLKYGGGTMEWMYFIQLTASIDFFAISGRFFQQVNFNNTNPYSVLWSLLVQIEPYEYILSFVPSFWATYKRTKIHFWLNDRLISIEREKKKSIIYPATCILWHRSSHKHREPEILKYPKISLFLSLLCVVFGFPTPKKLTHTK